MLPYALSFIAGLLTALSPCVLPALPLIVSGAERESRFGPLAVAFGMIISFTALGVFFASFGGALSGAFGVDVEMVRTAAALAMTVFGVVLIVPALKARLTAWLMPLSSFTGSHVGMSKWSGFAGQFLLGSLLGALWSPCVGPTLGGAIALASASGGTFPATLMMLLFGIGSAAPLVVMAYGARQVFLTQRLRIKAFADVSRPILGFVLVIFGLAVSLGVDKSIEATLVSLLPEVWVNLVTRY